MGRNSSESAYFLPFKLFLSKRIEVGVGTPVTVGFGHLFWLRGISEEKNRTFLKKKTTEVDLKSGMWELIDQLCTRYTTSIWTGTQFGCFASVYNGF